MVLDPFSLIHWIAPAIAVGGSIVYFVMRHVHVNRSRSWPLVPGTIEGTMEKSVGHSRGVEITYVYWVEGHVYSGQCDRMLRKSFTKAEEVLIKGRPILVRYHPLQPEEAVIVDDDQFQDIRELVK
jgi:hypothetical protein